MKAITTIRNNWKKTVFGLATAAFAIDYGYDTYQISNLMKVNCREAATYGEQTGPPRKVIVILNPAANKKKSEKNFQKFCEPILHLGGFMVDVVRTDSEGFAKTYIEELNTLPSAVIVAGGDGTISEVLTGMMRRKSDRCPIALLPLGNNNDIVRKHLGVSLSSKVDRAESVMKATLNIVKGSILQKSVIKIEQQPSKEEDTVGKPIYAMGSLKWGIDHDLNTLQEKYWYFGSARKYVTPFINAFNKGLSWDCKADVCYSLPCPGCTNCTVETDKKQHRKSWWASGLWKKDMNVKLLALNPECNIKHNTRVDSSNIRVYVEDSPDGKKLVLEKEGNLKPGLKFLYNYLSSISNNGEEHTHKNCIECRTITLVPEGECKGSNKFFSIDNELYDVRPISLTLVPNAVELYQGVELEIK